MLFHLEGEEVQDIFEALRHLEEYNYAQAMVKLPENILNHRRT